MDNQKEVIKNREDLKDDPAIKEALGDADKYQSLAALQNLDGGKILLDALKQDIVGHIDTLTSSFKEATHIELLATLSRLEAKLAILRLITRAKTNLDGVNEFLDEALK